MVNDEGWMMKAVGGGVLDAPNENAVIEGASERRDVGIAPYKGTFSNASL